MRDVIFRQEKLIDRQEEINFLKNWFENIPKEILWIYGPKSSGKTTLIEYIIERELIKDLKLASKSNYWVKYINFRRTMVGSYDSFINSFFEEIDEEDDKIENLSRKYKLWIFELKASTMKKIKEKKKNLFPELIEELKTIDKKKIIIVDEIQVLEDIYYNNEKELLKEFLNFCVSLTKEMHLAHVVILSSNTIFINRIYNDAKLKVTSSFYKIPHLDYKTILEWLKEEGFTDKDIELIREYLGGCIPLIQRMMRDKDRFNNLQEYLYRQKWLAYTEIFMILKKEKFSKEEKDKFEEICKIILKDGCYIPQKSDNLDIAVIEKWSEKEILFFDPLEVRVTGNNRLYEKGMELLIEQV